MNTEERLDNHEKRITHLEVDSAKLDARFDSLLKSTENLKRVVYVFTFVLLLAVVYGALGPKGFNAVTHAAPIAKEVPNGK